MDKPDSKALSQWKSTFGSIFEVVHNDQPYIFRRLKLFEFKAIQQIAQESSLEAEEKTVELALLFPEEVPENISAGVITAIALAIRERSGFYDKELISTLLTEIRQKSDNATSFMKAFIIAAMPAINDKELDNLDCEQLIEKVVLAERVFRVQQESLGMEPNMEVVIENPAEEEEAARRKYIATKKDGTAGYDDPIARKLLQHGVG